MIGPGPTPAAHASRLTQPTWIILGAGFTGARLAHALHQAGARVIVTRRTRSDAEAIARNVAGDQTSSQPSMLALAIDLDDATSCAALTAFAAGAIVVHSAPPSSPAAEANLLSAIAGAAHLVYISSTGVYGAGHGRVVDESAAIAPLSQSGRARADAEARLQTACQRADLSYSILRASGIYGATRSLVGRARAGMMRIIGDGQSIVCRIHVDDLVTAVIAAGQRQCGGVFNISDDDPSPTYIMAHTVCQAINLPVPTAMPVSSVSGEVAAMLLANRIISNQRMHDLLGVTLQFPSWRSTLAAEVAVAGEVTSPNS
ncbi:MAG: NAD-dependent epimerase/dehydratase family protein [Kofleriaceae bacterium]|nr:NAD-dependent epimerase/dehydratase family protein [Kofleriaceae bacterium]